MHNILTGPPVQSRSTLNEPIERRLQAVQNDFSLPTLEVDVTPILARHWLEWNQCVRRLSRTTITLLSRQMTIGQFHWVGDPIRLGELHLKTLRRPLRDGQHRLHGIIHSGKTIRCTVIFDFPERLFPFIDEGKPRHARDFIQNQNYTIAALISGAARYVHLFERRINFMTARELMRLSNAEILDTAERHPALTTWAKEAHQTKRMALSPIVAASYWISSSPDSRVDEFLSKLFDPSGLQVTDMLYHLGERLRWERKEFYHGSRGRAMIAWAMFRAWELFKNNETRKIIRLIGGPIPWPDGAPYLSRNGNTLQEKKTEPFVTNA